MPATLPAPASTIPDTRLTATAVLPEVWLLKYANRPGYKPAEDLIAGSHLCFFTADHAIDAAVLFPDCYPERITP